MYDSANFLYANPVNRYAIGNRTSGLVYGHNGSLTLSIQHAEPATASARANWLPAPAGPFHMILRLYLPAAAALDEAWKPPPAFRVGEVLRPVLNRLRVAHDRVRYTDSQVAMAHFTISHGGRVVARFAHRDRAGENHLSLRRFHLRPGRYHLLARAIGAAASYDNAPGRKVRLVFKAR
jgi:hypothetical protein